MTLERLHDEMSKLKIGDLDKKELERAVEAVVEAMDAARKAGDVVSRRLNALAGTISQITLAVQTERAAVRAKTELVGMFSE